MHLIHIFYGLALAQCAVAETHSPTRRWRSLVRRADNETAAAAAGNETDPSPFASIVPSETLQWTPCLEAIVDNVTASNLTSSRRRFECARLLVPYDYDHPNASAGQFSLAVIRSPAVDRTHYKGPMFFNFGGPGGSGTEDLMSKLLGPGAGLTGDLLAGYDIVSWDPRGVGSTLPALNCYATEASRLYNLGAIMQAALYGANDSLARLDAQFQVRAMGCEQYSGDILPYVGTMYAAQDLRRLVEACGYSDKLSYVGISYGTFLGAMYAALYPNKIERMILDGVEDPTYASTEIYNPQQYTDADEILDNFFHWCFLAGQERCEFWFDSPAAIRDAFFELDHRLRAHPYPVPAGYVFTWAQFRSQLFQQLYWPLDEFPAMAGKFAQLRNGTFNASLPGASTSENPFAVPSLTDPHKKIKNGVENTQVVTCADRPSWSIGDLNEADAYLRSPNVTDATIFGSYTVGLMSLLCGRLKTNTTKRYNGTFTNIHTSTPILFVSSVYDPVTPLHMAYSTSAGFIGSSVLVNNITSHTGLAQMSNCTTNALRAYLHDATLPVNGTMCQPELLPWGLLPEEGFAPENATVDGFMAGEAAPSHRKKDLGQPATGSKFW